MKLNFWQILGVLLIVCGAIFVIRKQMSSSTVPRVAPTTQLTTP